MVDLPEDGTLQAWYLSTDGQKHDIAQEAYRDAVEYLKRELKGKSQATDWIERKCSLEEIRIEAEQVETQYLTASVEKKSALHCMRKISAWIMYYGQVLDVLSQHHPEYVSLAWGATKFLLVGILNHEKLNSSISQALSDISSALPRLELHAKLYPTPRMRDNMSRLYAHILLFLRLTITWFSSSSTTRAVSSIFSPFELRHRPLLESIRQCTQSITAEATAASHAEVRDLHHHVRHTSLKITSLEQSMSSRFDEVHAKLDDMRCDLTHVRNTSTTVQATVLDLQRNEILTHLRPATDPDTTLARHRALARRASPWRDGNSSTVELIRRLGGWVCQPGVPVLLLCAAPRARGHAREVAMEMVEVLDGKEGVSAWWLGEGDCVTQRHGGRVEMIKSLVFQLLRRAPEAIEGLDAARFQGRHGEEEWADLLCAVVKRVGRCFLLVEMGVGREGRGTTAGREDARMATNEEDTGNWGGTAERGADGGDIMGEVDDGEEQTEGESIRIRETIRTRDGDGGIRERDENRCINRNEDLRAEDEQTQPQTQTQTDDDNNNNVTLAMLETVASQFRDTTSPNQLKILVLTGDAEAATAFQNPELVTTMTVQKPNPPPPHLRRPRTRQNPRALAWAGVKKGV